MDTMASQEQPAWRGWLRSRSTWVLRGFLAIGAFFLITEHTAHVLGALPYVLLLACPLLHLFMHGGHGGHGGHADHGGAGGAGGGAQNGRPGSGEHAGHTAAAAQPSRGAPR